MHPRHTLQKLADIVQTDDVGVVESASSHEYYLAGTHLSLNYLQIWEIALSGINRCFVSEVEKQNCRRQLVNRRDEEGSA